MKRLYNLEQKLKLPSRIEPLFLSDHSGCQLFIKREDLIHPFISGNKWRKLKYNLKHFLESNYDAIISVGGPFSNHLVALAVACFELKIPCSAIVRGQKIDENNLTLKLCRKYGMKLIPVSHDNYAKRNNSEFISTQFSFSNPYFIPEGGSNDKHDSGCEEMLNEIDISPDFIVLPIGTGGTMAAFCQSDCESIIVGISPFKEGKVDIPFLSRIEAPHMVLYDFAMNGYGRYNKEMVNYINSFWKKFEIPLDPIYNAKGMMALESLLTQRYFPVNSKILYIHTGGLQGIKGFNYIHNKKSIIKIPHNIYFPEADL